MSGKLRKTTLKEQAYHAIEEMIASYRFSSGTWINVEQLAKEMGVSRTPVWQALRDLEKAGLVTHVRNRGIRMAEMTPDMAMDLYVVREVLEGLAARMAAERLDGRVPQELDALLREQYSIVQSCDLMAYSKSDFRFHQVLYDACGNWLLHELLANIKSRSRPLVCDIRSILPKLYEDHVLVVDALKRRDPVEAEERIREHNRRMRAHLQESRNGALSSGDAARVTE